MVYLQISIKVNKFNVKINCIIKLFLYFYQIMWLHILSRLSLFLQQYVYNLHAL